MLNQSPIYKKLPVKVTNVHLNFKSDSIELFGSLQKHRKITKIEINNFEKLRTLFLQKMLAQKEINVKIRQFRRI